MFSTSGLTYSQLYTSPIFKPILPLRLNDLNIFCQKDSDISLCYLKSYRKLRYVNV